MKYTANFAALALSLLFLTGCFGNEWYEEFRLIGTVAENITEVKRLVIDHCYSRPEGKRKEIL